MVDGPLDDAREELETVLASMPSGIVQGDGSLHQVGPLLIIAALRSSGRSLEGALLTEVASRLELEPECVQRTAAFCDDLLASTNPDEPLQVTLCRGMTCTLHGADGLHPLFKRAMREAGVSHDYLDVFCLSQCEHGPSIMVGKHVWVTRAQDVVADDREWRQGDSGPVPVDGSDPVVD